APSTTSGPSSIETTEGGGGETISFAEQGGIDYGVTAPASFVKPAEGHYHEIYDFYLFTNNHKHKMDHTHVIPAHDHEIRFGIFEGPSATAIGLLVDGNNVGGARVSETNLDLVDFLEVDDEGKIKRGQWH